MKKLNLGFGGHPLKNDDFNFMQASYSEVIKAIISIFDPSLNIILSGFIINDNGTTISCTEGYVSWLGEVYIIGSASFPKVSGGQLYLKLIENTVSPSPVVYKDQTTQNVHIDRKLQLKYFAAGDTGEYLAAFTRTSSLGFKRGMIIDYIGNSSANFDDRGLGINEMSGFAICNGNTFTISGGISYTVPDLRGRKRVGATNVPNQGAPAYNGNLGTYNITSTDGSPTVTLSKANIPNYDLTVIDPGHFHTVTGRVGISDNADDRGVMESNGSSNTSVAQTNITVKSGGSGQALNIMNPYWAGIPVIKL